MIIYHKYNGKNIKSQSYSIKYFIYLFGTLEKKNDMM